MGLILSINSQLAGEFAPLLTCHLCQAQDTTDAHLAGARQGLL